MANAKRITQTSAAALCALLIAANGVPAHAEETPPAQPDTITEQTAATAADLSADPAQEPPEETKIPAPEETPNAAPDAVADPVPEAPEDPVNEPSADPESEEQSEETDASDVTDTQPETEDEASVPAESEEEAPAEAAPPAGQVICNGQTSDIVFDGDLGNENSADILGDSWFYGITADTFTFNGESETNFAVKNFEHAYQGAGQTGVTDKGAGSERAWFVAGSVDAPFMVKGLGADITVPEGSDDLFTNSTNGSDLKFNNLSQDVIDEYIDDLRNDASKESTRLAGLNSIRDYSTLPQNQMTINVTSAGTSTVYLNADAWDGLKNMMTQSSGITIKKNPGQKVVINYPSSTNVTTQKIIIDQDGVRYDTTALANRSTRDLTVAEDIIINMPAAANVALNDTTGIILAPNAEVHCYGVDGGWITCKHMVNDCEWHFINGQLPSQMVLGTKRHEPKHYGPEPDQPKDDTPSESDTPEETPSESEDIPEEPETPEVTPSEPEKPSVPETPEETPSVTPDAPEEQPSEPVETPEEPKQEETVPDQPTHVEPEITPSENTLSDKPSDVIPPEKNQSEENAPETPAVTPETPSVSDNPEEIPSELEDTPEKTEDTPSVPVIPNAPSVPETPQPQPEITTTVVQPVTPSVTKNEDAPGVLGESRRSESPDTSDNNQIAWYGTSLIGSLLILALWFFFRKKYTES